MKRTPLPASGLVLGLGLGLLAGLVVMTLPTAAWACPFCAGRTTANPYAQAALIGGFVFFPFGVVYTVVRFIRAGMRRVEADGFSTGARDPGPHSMHDGDRR